MARDVRRTTGTGTTSVSARRGLPRVSCSRSGRASKVCEVCSGDVRACERTGESECVREATERETTMRALHRGRSWPAAVAVVTGRSTNSSAGGGSVFFA